MRGGITKYYSPPCLSAHLAGLHHAAEARLYFLEAVGDVVVVDSSAAVVNHDRAEAELLRVECSRG